MVWGIRNKRLKLILPLPYKYHSKAEATMAMEELISFGKDLETKNDLGRILEVVPLFEDKKEG